MNTLSTRQDLVCFPKVETKFEVPELRAEFWGACFRKGSGDGGNVWDRHGMWTYRMAFLTSGSVMMSHRGETRHIWAHKFF